MGNKGLKLSQRRKDLSGCEFGRLTALYSLPEVKRHCAVWVCMCRCGKEKRVRSTDLQQGRTKSCGCLASPSLVGKRFGRLVVERRTKTRRNKAVLWKCKCDCGKYTVVDTGHLNNGHTSSCGCFRKDQRRASMKKNLIDKTGQKFGRLTVVGRVFKNGTYNYFSCRCDCGEIVTVWASSLTQGHTVSCGCFQHFCRLSHTKVLMKADCIPIELLKTAKLHSKISKYLI